MLRILAGFTAPDAGGVYFEDQCVNAVAPQRRDSGMVFQNYALWPHMNVADNVAFGLEVRGVGARQRLEQVREALATVHLQELAHRRPGELSGGQQQRVALARALVIRPRCLLLDEPLSNLDAKLRVEMRKITIPLIAPNMIAGGLLAFSFAVLEVSDSLVLAQRTADYPVSKAIFDLYQRLGDGPAIASALGVWAMLLLSATLLAASVILGRRLGALFRT